MSGDMERETKEKDKTYPNTYSGKSFGDVDHIVNADGSYLFCKYWKPEKEIRALTFFLHGYAEHCLRYQELAEKLNEIGVFCFSHDQVAHGESQGIRGYVTDYNIPIRDAFQHIDMMKEKYPDLPIFVYGHSMGGGYCAFLAAKRPTFFKGCLFSAPFIQPSGDTATPFKTIMELDCNPFLFFYEVFGLLSNLQVFMARIVARIAPKLRIGKLDLSYLSRDQKAIDEYKNDPLNDCDGMMACCAIQFLDLSNDIKEVMPKIESPIYVAHSEDDKVNAFAGAKLLHEVSKSKDKTFRAYKDALHMLEHEQPEFVESFFTDITQWINERI